MIGINQELAGIGKYFVFFGIVFVNESFDPTVDEFGKFAWSRKSDKFEGRI